MKFCPECGTKAEGMKFCPECGYKLGEVAAAIETTTAPVELNKEETLLLTFQTHMFGMENKKGMLGKFEISIPQYNYELTTERLLINKVGVISTKKDEIELYKIKDVTVKQGMKEKLGGFGDIEIQSSDTSHPTYTIKRIKDPNNVKETIRCAVREIKNKMNISYKEEI
ncbi:PH domain-containing protein [Niallia taxi]|mgnify:CR=1 FL=1|uniref:PH domain-containing protein n=1 Tax=Niallia taxi TaxID=2499688 RepID=UPI002934965D|nr:PH domain-containing protein [Niallia taxi]WOD61751.1 PH domain-containing protein [Niallia taxi]